MTLLTELGLTNPVWATPMAGGPTTPELVLAAADAGGLALLAGGYQTAERLAGQLDQVRTRTFGVNLFAPNPLPVDPGEYARYRDLLGGYAGQFKVALPEAPVENDDGWRDKVDLLLDRPVPLVSFTFGLPDPAVVAAFHRVGTLLVQAVTSAEEAALAAGSGVDALVVQAAAAGGHSATFTPLREVPATPLPELVGAVRRAVGLPVLAAGGLSDAGAVALALRAGAEGVLVGTALLLAPEAGTSVAHRTALTDPGRGDTVVTRSFTGRPARGLPNEFTRQQDGSAPFGYPALHHLTGPIRRASAAAGNPEYVNLWAGTGYRNAVARPAADILRDLCALA